MTRPSTTSRLGRLSRNRRTGPLESGPGRRRCQGHPAEKRLALSGVSRRETGAYKAAILLHADAALLSWLHDTSFEEPDRHLRLALRLISRLPDGDAWRNENQALHGPAITTRDLHVALALSVAHAGRTSDETEALRDARKRLAAAHAAAPGFETRLRLGRV